MNRMLESIEFSRHNNKSTRGTFDEDDYDVINPNKQKIYSSKNDTFGEITGDVLNNSFERHELGMPLRSNYTIKKPTHNPNEYRNFDLTSPANTSAFNIKPSDPNSGSISNNYSDIEASMTQISTQLKPTNICSDEITKLAVINYLSMTNSIGNSFGINSLGLYSIFAYLYFSSDSLTEIELKKHFNFPDKNILHSGLSNIINGINVLDEIFFIKNIILLPKSISYNSKYIKKMEKFCKVFICDDDKDIITESEKINKILIDFSRLPTIKKILIPSNLINFNSILINTLKISPIWEYEFDKIINEEFYITENEHYTTTFLKGTNMPFGYYEDEKIKLVEIPMVKNIAAMGIILQKHKQLDIEKIKLYISQLKKTTIKEIIFPMFMQHFKFRYIDLLRETGLTTIFKKLSCPNFMQDEIPISDVIQNIFVHITNKYNIKKTDIKIRSNPNSTKKMIINVPFTYYFRLVDTNTIFYIGKF